MSRIEDFLREDIGYGDITSEALIGDQMGAARLFAKEECVVAGLEEAEEVFNTLGLWTAARVKDGGSVLPGTEVLYVEGSLRSILAGERLALNFLMRMSGIATATRNVSVVVPGAEPEHHRRGDQEDHSRVSVSTRRRRWRWAGGTLTATAWTMRS